MSALYVHVPFCQHICSYCDFCKVFYDEKWSWDYLKALSFEIKDKYGIPCFSKEQDFFIYYYQNALRKGKEPSPSIKAKIYGTYSKGFGGISKTARRYVLSENAHKITHKCCEYLKKKWFK